MKELDFLHHAYDSVSALLPERLPAAPVAHTASGPVVIVDDCGTSTAHLWSSMGSWSIFGTSGLKDGWDSGSNHASAKECLKALQMPHGSPQPRRHTMVEACTRGPAPVGRGRS